MSVTSWDDYPVHQSANWIAHVATSDRNFYDRYYFNAFDTGGQFMAVFGLGQYEPRHHRRSWTSPCGGRSSTSSVPRSPWATGPTSGRAAAGRGHRTVEEAPFRG
ncbi:MAG: hypothetical protein U0W40_16040 [Acidimicrobiia bacterium]